MVKKILSILLASLMLFSCLPIDSQAAEIDLDSSGAGSISVSAAKNEEIDVIISIKQVSNIQGLFLDLDKAYSKFRYESYEILDSRLSDNNVFVNSSPVDYVYTDILTSVNFPDGGLSYTKTTDVLKFTYKARALVDNYSYSYTVKEIYDSNLKDISSDLISVRYQKKEEAEATLSSLTVYAPSKTTYNVGESLNTSGMKVTAVYSDSTTKDVTSSAVCTGFDSSTAGTKTVTVSYTEGSVTKTGTFNVVIKAVELSKIAVTTTPTKTSYYVGESFDKTGVKITATYSDNTTKDVTSSTQFSGFDSSTAGTKTITASFNGKTANFTVTVNSVTVSSIAVTTKPTKTEYYVGDTFSSAGAKITATYNNGSTADVTSSATYSGFSSTSAGTKTITVTYSGKTATFTVTIKSELQNNSTINNPTVSSSKIYEETCVGDIIEINGAASGGSGSYTYSYSVMSSLNNTWSYIEKDTSKTKVTFSADLPSTYYIKVEVKDSRSKVAEKIFTISIYSSLKNNSSVSSSSVYLGDTVKINVSASGGKGTYTYTYYYKKSSDSSWTAIESNTTKTSVTFKPTTSAKYSVKTVVKDGNGRVSEKEINNINVISSVSNTSTATSTTIQANETIKIVGSATGGTGKYTYQFSYKNPTAADWTIKSDYGKATSIDLTPVSVGTYQVRVIAKDGNGKTAQKIINITVKEALKNTSTISKTSIQRNKSVKVTASATGGVGSYSYEFLYKKSTDSDWTVKSSYGNSTSIDFTPGAVGTYQIKVNVKDSNDTIVSKTFTIYSKEVLKNTSAASKTLIVKNTTIKVTGTSSGGVGTKQYQFSYKNPTAASWTVKSEYGKASYINLTPVSVGKYQVKVDVKDANGTVESKTINITVNDVLKNTSTASKTTIQKNTNIVITGSATGGIGTYSYRFSYKKSTDTEWNVKSEYGKAVKIDFAPASVAVYNVKVEAKDSEGNEASKTISITVNDVLKNTSTVTKSTIQKNDTITISGAATGGVGSCQYEFSYKNPTATDWTVKSAYGKAKSINLTPVSVGTYKVKVNVKDKNETVATKTFSITVKDVLKNTSAAEKTQIIVNDVVEIKGAATGGVGSYQYEFSYKNPTATDWTVRSAYGKATSIKLYPASVGTYQVKVNVKDQNATVAEKIISIKVNGVLTNTSTVSASTVKNGENVVIKGSATGGIESYQYEFAYKNPTATDWIIKSEYGKTKSVDLAPASSGTYKVRVNVKDKEGTVKTKTFNITVIGELKNTSTVSATSVKVGDVVVIKGSAAEGTGSYQYEFAYKSPTATDWKVKSEYGKAKSVDLAPASSGTYKVRVNVKDKEGTVKTKTFNITVTGELKNTSTVSAASVKVGDVVVIKGSATGGTGSYEYEFSYKSPTATDWKVKSEYGKEKSVNLAPVNVGTYEVKINVKDSSGTVKTSSFKIVVSK